MYRTTDLLRSSSLLLGTIAASAALCPAQSQLYSFDGDGINDRLGSALAAAGDVNNDSFPDLIVGAPEDFDVFALKPGYARVYSGKDGSVLLTLTNGGAANNGEKFGSAVDGIGDINGDGFDDLIVGVPGESTNGSLAGEARVLSGQDGQQLFSVLGDASGHKAGSAVSGAGDVNADGTPDFIVGIPGAAPNGANSGMVRIYSGSSGVLLLEVPGQATSDRFGISVDAAGDLNGDGFDDVLVGSFYGGARVVSGLDGSTLQSWSGAGTNDFLGFAVRGIPDVTGDSIPDVMVGAIQPSVFVAGGKGYAKVYNGATGAELFHFDGTTVGDHFGYDLDLAGDHNGDGVLDFLVSADQDGTGGEGYARVYSGIGGTLLATYTGATADNLFGTAVAFLGDANGDGSDEFAVGEPHESSQSFVAGRVKVQSGAAASCGLPSNYCTGLVNSTGVGAGISYLGTNSVANNDLFLFATGLPPNQFGLFYYGGGAVNLPLGNGLRCVSQPAYRLPVTTTGPSGTTAWLLDTTNPPEPMAQITVGSTWYFQYWYRDPAAGGSAANLSNGLMVPFCP